MQNALAPFNINAQMTDRELVAEILRDPILRQTCELMTLMIIERRRGGEQNCVYEFSLRGRQVVASVREQFASVVVPREGG